MNKYKKIYIMIVLAALFFPFFSHADEIKEENINFKSEVIAIKEAVKTLENKSGDNMETILISEVSESKDI